MVIAFLAPESPWFLVRNERFDEAKHSILRLSGSKTEDQISAQLAMMLHTNKIESEVVKGTTYLDCFRGQDLRRTEIVCMALMGQILSGSSFAYTPTFFFTSAGMAVKNAFNLGLGATGMAWIGTMLSWWLLSYFGRRTIYVTGAGILSAILLLIGILAVTAGSNALWPSGGLCLFWLFTYSLTIGPVAVSVDRPFSLSFREKLTLDVVQCHLRDVIHPPSTFVSRLGAMLVPAHQHCVPSVEPLHGGEYYLYPHIFRLWPICQTDN